MADFAQRLKEVRKAAGVSQQAIADRMLIPKRTIEKWETGERTPPDYVQRFVLNELQSIGTEKATKAEHDPKPTTATYVRTPRRAREENEDNVWSPPLGYKVENGLIVVDEEEAEIVHRASEEMAKNGCLSPETSEDMRRIYQKSYRTL